MARIGRVRVLQRAVLAALAAGCGCSAEGDPAPPRAAILPVRTLVASFQDSYTVTQRYTGRLTPRRTVELGFEIDGKVVAFRVDEGVVVAEGDVLAVLESTMLEAERDQLAAERQAARAKLAELRDGPRPEVVDAARARVQAEEAVTALLASKRERLRKLLAKGTVTQEAFDDVDFRATAAANRRDAARHRLRELEAGTRPEQVAAQEAVVGGLDAALRQVGIRISKCTLAAPFAGTIARRATEEGAVVRAGHPVLRLVEDEWEARVSLPLAVAETLAPGDERELTAGSRRYRARVATLLPELDASTLQVHVVFVVERDGGAEGATPFAGRLVFLTLPHEVAARGAWLPASALVKGVRGLWSCFAVASSGEATADGALRVERRDVEVLHADADRVFVRGTIRPGDRIVSNGVHRVVSGQLVTLAREE